MTRNAFHGIKIDLSSVFLRKSQGDKRLRSDLHKLTLKFRTVFLICIGAGFSVESKHNRIKNRCFSGAGISGDQE